MKRSTNISQSVTIRAESVVLFHFYTDGYKRINCILLTVSTATTGYHPTMPGKGYWVVMIVRSNHIF